MPEFNLDVHDDYGTWKRLDAFTRGYVECMFFTETEHGTSADDHDPETQSQLHGDLTFADLAPETLKSMIEDCQNFQESNAELLDRAYDDDGYSENQAGHDFWLTRNGHGSGFWDRGLPDDIGKALTDMSHPYGEQCAYLGDDGKVYVQ